MTATDTTEAPTARALRDALAAGHIDLTAYVEALLDYARAADERLHLFADLDERVIRAQVAERLAQRQSGQPLPPLWGVPVAVKDIIDTADFPTAYGSPLYAGRYPVADATVVRRLRQAGAIIFGKTVTTEFATYHPGPTRNPHHPEHTPGGSSSGSAAAVAAGVVPVALGTQTNGSMLRPASFCGVYGFKPSRGEVPRTGVFPQSPSLDEVGLFARAIDDLALVGEWLTGDDGSDPATAARAPQRWFDVATATPPLPPRFAFVRTPWWPRMEPEARAACEAFIAVMDGVVDEVPLPAVVERAVAWHATVNDAELALALHHAYHQRSDALSPTLRERLQRAQDIRAVDYLLARDRMPHVAAAFDEYFDRYDAILTPAALGAAPRGLASTGDPIMQTVWTFAGLPMVALPLLRLHDDLPFGIQAIGAARQDARLLRAARALVQIFEERTAS